MPQPGGHWESTNNDIVERHPDGSSRDRFRPVAAHLTPMVVTDLITRYHTALDRHRADPLVLVPLAILDLLCIHPFPDGNGRMARLLTLQLLNHFDDAVGRFISLERIFEVSKESCIEKPIGIANAYVELDRQRCRRQTSQGSAVSPAGAGSRAAARQSFAFETTLSGSGYLRHIRKWQSSGYRVKLLFLRLDRVDEAIVRVAQQVRQGGHHIPEATIRRCFGIGRENFTRLYAPQVDAWALYSNSWAQPVLLDWSEKP